MDTAAAWAREICDGEQGPLAKRGVYLLPMIAAIRSRLQREILVAQYGV